LIYESLDEKIDYGLSQSIESQLLNDFIMIESDKKTKYNKENFALKIAMTTIVC